MSHKASGKRGQNRYAGTQAGIYWYHWLKSIHNYGRMSSNFVRASCCILNQMSPKFISNSPIENNGSDKVLVPDRW